MKIALYSSGRNYFDLLEEDSGGLDAGTLKVTTDQLQNDLKDLEVKVGVAKLTTYGTELAGLRNDLDHLVGKRKGIDKTYEKTEDGRRGILGQRQERMKKRNANNVEDLAEIEQRFIALDNKLYKEAGIVSERRMRMLIEQQTRALAASGAIITDANGNATGIDAGKLSQAQGALEANLKAGKDLWGGDVSAEKIVDAGGEGIVGGAMAKAGYEGKNIKTTITIAKVLVGLMIFNYYWNNTSGLGEKLARGAVLYGLLSSNALGGWDIFWKGGQNSVLNTSQFFGKGSGDFTSYSPEIQKKYDLLSKGRDKVEGLKRLFVPEKRDNLKQYLKFDGSNWVFDNNAFLTDYNLRNINPAASPITAVSADLAKAKPLTDLNEAEAGGVIASLIHADKYDGGAELNKQLNAYLSAAGITSADAVATMPLIDLDAKLATAAAELKKTAETERTALEQETNTWLKKHYPGHVVMEGKAQEVKDIIGKGQAVPTAVAELQGKGLIREVTKDDAVVVDDAETKTLITGLTTLPDPFPESEASALVIAFNTMRQLSPMETINAELRVFDGKLYYQNHGRKVALSGRSQSTGLAFDFNSIGINGNEQLGAEGFLQNLMIADVITNVWSVAAGAIDAWGDNTSSKVGINKYPRKWNEGAMLGRGAGLSLYDETSVFDFTDEVSTANTMLKLAIPYETGRNILGDKLATLLNSMKRGVDGESIRPKGKGGLPPETLALGPDNKVLDQGGTYAVDYQDAKTIGEVMLKVNKGIMNTGSVLWSDVVTAVNRVGGDVGGILAQAIPGTAKIVGIAYDETKKGVGVLYEDGTGAINRIYTDGKKAMRMVYDDGKSFTMEVLGPDMKKLGTWVIDTAGGWTQDAIKEAYEVFDVLLSEENVAKLKAYIDKVGGLVGKTVEEAGEVITTAAKTIVKSTNDTIWNWETRKLIGTYLGYQVVAGIFE
ncbi:MAG: hypothetical protein WC004_01945 [Candidatus Absconditabacterales bacterium]